jgi:MATE family multidrug resistance protein
MLATERPARLDRHELGSVARLAWPVVVGQLGMMLLGVVDMILVGRIDAASLAGVSLGHTWSFAWLVLARGVSMGLDPVITQAHGARDPDAFGRALAHGAILVTLVSIPVTLLHGLAAAGLSAMGEPPEVIPLAQAYAWAVAPSVWAVALEGLLRQSQQAQGHMRAGLWVAVAGNLLNVPAVWVAIHGGGGWPGLGAVGAGVATSLVRWWMLAVMIGVAWDDVRALGAGLRRAELGRLGVLAALSLPVAAQMGLEVWGFSLGTLLAGWFGEDAVAAHTITLNLAALAFMVPLGIGAAASTRVGNLIGAGRPWGDAARAALTLGVGVMTLSAAAFATIPERLASLYVHDPGVIALAGTLLPLAACFQVFDGFQAVAFGVLRGAGDTAAPSVINIVAYYVVGLPLGAWLGWSVGLGVAGLWVGLTASLACVALMLFLRLRHVERRGGFRRTA